MNPGLHIREERSGNADFVFRSDTQSAVPVSANDRRNRAATIGFPFQVRVTSPLRLTALFGVHSASNVTQANESGKQ
jgi:hypothetical protein